MLCERPSFFTLFPCWILFFVVVGGASAQVDLPSARLEFQSTSVGVLIGFERGQGILTFNGEEYVFKVRGLSFFDIGGSSVQGMGVVYNLTDVADFEGTYKAVLGGVTAVQGGGSAVMTNANGVRISLDTFAKGLQISLGGGGLTFELAGESPMTESADDGLPPLAY